ncbi:MMPL family protein [Mycobacterium xenopi 4042]|uniref:MMPL family protein n=1 Tax=Mycobacterium xenopi 4042 TaxID=1299334 RepID=X8DIW1_MYCXE|nr:MMPL family protein [Mycobacterium xenopi 4042]
MIVGIAALSLIMLIMMFITRSLVAAIVIVGTVALSLGASFGLSVLVWQDILGIQLYWVVLALAVILLLAVGSDYNLLLISRFKEEIGAGLKTGTIRAMAGSGSVVTSAGLVFAATMSSFVFSALVILGQVGTTIALGLLFDTLVVRAFMTPSIATLLGRWFWWPQRVRPRARQPDASAIRTAARGSPAPFVGRRRRSGDFREVIVSEVARRVAGQSSGPAACSATGGAITGISCATGIFALRAPAVGLATSWAAAITRLRTKNQPPTRAGMPSTSVAMIHGPRWTSSTISTSTPARKARVR